jgi:membrane-bound acyltransferase YfiQ involved in biofilm formation
MLYALSAVLFLNHDITKIPVDNPLILNLSLILGFTFLTLITLKKTVNDKPLSILQSNQMKGLSIIIIIIHHLSLHTLEKPSDLAIFQNFGFKAVALFLVLSGFGLTISLQKKGITNFFNRRLARVYIPFLLVMILEILLSQILLNKNTHILTELFNAIFHANTLDRTMWFIIYILLWYCVIYLLYYLNLTNKSKLFFLFFVSLGILIASEPSEGSSLLLWKINAFSFPIGCWLGLNYKWTAAKIDQLINQNIGIILGVIIGCLMLSKFFGNFASTLYKQGIIGNYVFLCIAIIFWVALKNKQILRQNLIENISGLSAIVIIGFNYLNLSSYNAIAKNIIINTSAILAAFAIFLLISLMLRFNLYSLFLNWIGEISFELYLLHGMLMYTFDFILFRGDISITFFIYFIFICLSSILLNKINSGVYDLVLKNSLD